MMARSWVVYRQGHGCSDFLGCFLHVICMFPGMPSANGGCVSHFKQDAKIAAVQTSIRHALSVNQSFMPPPTSVYESVRPSKSSTQTHIE